ncbi:MAG: MGMT family protein [Acidimicrobiia bacterium]
MSEFERRVVTVLRSLRSGEVVSYGEVASQAGFPGAARAVGTLLRKTSTPLPWWRVVRADGSLASGHRGEQGRRLRAEGVKVSEGRVGCSR